MFRLIRSLFSSPERLLDVMSRADMREAQEEGERILIDEDGNASVNFSSPEVHKDFEQHVNALKKVILIPSETKQR